MGSAGYFGWLGLAYIMKGQPSGVSWPISINY